MTTLETGSCAVVTGAASGIGRALARAFGAEGMKVVLGDVNEPLLKEAADELTSKGVECVALAVDVSDAAAVERLAEQAIDRFGSVGVVCNNAGVSTIGKQWEIGIDDWDWVIGVCLRGVVNGVRSFVPRMLAHAGPAHVVITASMGGLLTSPFLGPYAAAKHAVVGLSKGLRAELAGTGSASPWCVPAWCARPFSRAPALLGTNGHGPGRGGQVRVSVAGERAHDRHGGRRGGGHHRQGREERSVLGAAQRWSAPPERAGRLRRDARQRG